MLADHVARVAVGQSRHVAKILVGVGGAPPPTTEAIREAAIGLLVVPHGADPWHRDGWIFQVISWIAATKNHPHAVVRAPHMIHAHKGFDGLLLEIDEAEGTVTAAVIFEDKATDNPRKTIREEVWPDFRKLEAGDRENFLSAEVTSLLATQPTIEPDKAIEKIIWQQVRRYRVSITVGASHATDRGRLQLFKGYDAVAAGDVQRRRGEIFEVTDLRPWVQTLAESAIEKIGAMGL
jgi:hypothetical protein